MAKDLRLPPYPKGWYCVGFSDDFPRKSVTTRRLIGKEVVLFRTESGALSAIDPICPHLGAHFGHGGTVVKECVRCPFHGFLFDASGACVATGYGTKAPRVSARTWPVAERHGAVLVWADPRGGPPTFAIPALDMADFSPLKTAVYRFRGHPQDTTENSVDIGHLTIVHGYEQPRMLSELVVDGASLHATYEFHRPVGLLGRGFGGVTADFDAHVHGLGYSFVEARIGALGLTYRNFVLATPVGEMDLELRIAATVKRLNKSQLRGPMKLVGLSSPLSKLVEAVIHARGFQAFQNDVEQDFLIWKHKEYVPRPALAAGDGPVMRYRRWAEQFYDETSASPAVRAET